MMISKKWIKNGISLVLFVLFLVLLTSTGYGAADQEQRVFDQADLLSQTEINDLELLIAQLRKKTNMDIVVVTITDADGKTTRSYADDFYSQGNFGSDSAASGVMFLLDLDNREIYVNASGNMIRILTDSRKESILDAVYPNISDRGDYQKAITQFLAAVEQYVDQGIPVDQYNYDEQTGKISKYRSINRIEFMVALVIALIAAWLPCRSIKHQYAMKKADQKKANASQFAYRASASFGYRQQQDLCVDTRVTHRRIPRSSNNSHLGGGSGSSSSSSGRSTTHQSSGRTYSGSGRKF